MCRVLPLGLKNPYENLCDTISQNWRSVMNTAIGVGVICTFFVPFRFRRFDPSVGTASFNTPRFIFKLFDFLFSLTFFCTSIISWSLGKSFLDELKLESLTSVHWSKGYKIALAAWLLALVWLIVRLLFGYIFRGELLRFIWCEEQKQSEEISNEIFNLQSRSRVNLVQLQRILNQKIMKMIKFKLMKLN